MGQTIETIPFTVSYLLERFQVDENTLFRVCETLNLTLQRHPQSGQPQFTHRDVEILRRAFELQRQGGDLSLLGSTLDVPQMTHATKSQPVMPLQAATKIAPKQDINAVIEAVSHAKEGIMKDISRLIDDKLAGLDEVVVELIRAKSESESLKLKLTAVETEKRKLEAELASFKPVQFGFYRKF